MLQSCERVRRVLIIKLQNCKRSGRVCSGAYLNYDKHVIHAYAEEQEGNHRVKVGVEDVHVEADAEGGRDGEPDDQHAHDGQQHLLLDRVQAAKDQRDVEEDQPAADEQDHQVAVHGAVNLVVETVREKARRNQN